ncbi:tail fiber domain-containing protein [Flavobacterium dankookense]|uniref:Putative secreted protein (Por secretion system target) n=1 Tax=Flavobacterium dankookense TaxID=706186 RepID=A0A4R6QBT2_9FLAO|nr:tail fiber domain-containing protein [Flavobacterium dankookense]TDP60204.1 putative secreted protein (Por secretion system target) [Flavobacterium dankookense]
MKTKLLFFILLSGYLVFGQATINQSAGAPQAFINNPAPLGPQFGAEIFRFRSGFISQLDSGNNFGFTNSRWFAMGRVPAGTQTFYGLRFQLENRGLVMGYNNLTATNPLIQWIGTGANLGNLEFRVANGFGAPGTPASDLLVATMTNTGNTVFGDPTIVGSAARVNVENRTGKGVEINSTFSLTGTSTSLNITHQNGSIGPNIGIGMLVTNSNTTSSTRGVNVKMGGGNSSVGFECVNTGGSVEAIGYLGKTNGTSPFEAAVYGITPANGNQWAGYFDGKVFSTGGYSQPSDQKLKENIQLEKSVLEKIALLKPVTYDYKNLSEINLPRGIQHGFISQELATVFPELTEDVRKPVYDKENNISSNFDFKSVNYTGLISVLTAGIQELNTELEKQKLNTDKELQTLKDEIAALKEENTAQKLAASAIKNGFSLEQNIPNPFTDRTIINYSLSTGVNKGNIMIFDLTGKLIKDFPVNENKGQITITASQIGKGLFIYSLVQNGQELISKKMIVQ